MNQIFLIFVLPFSDKCPSSVMHVSEIVDNSASHAEVSEAIKKVWAVMAYPHVQV